MSKTAKTDVIINAEQAKAQLKEIQGELVKVKTLRDKAMADGDVKGFNQLNQEFKKLTSEAAKMQKQTFDVNQILKNMSSASARELNTAYQQMNRELKDMKRNDPGYAEKQKQVKALKGELDSANGSMGRQGITLKGLMGTIGGWAAGLGIATGAMSAVKAVIGATDTLSDKFEETIGGLTAGMSYFSRSLATLDFSNFLTNMAAAIEAGAEYVKTLDKIGDRTRAITIIEAKDRERLADLQIVMRTVTNEKEVRIAAGKEILEIELRNATLRKTLKADELDAELKYASKMTGLSEKRIGELLVEQETNRDVLESVEVYNKALADKRAAETAAAQQSQMTTKFVAPVISKETLATINSATPAIKKLASEMQSLGKLNETEYERITTAFKNVGEANASFSETTARTQVRLAKLNAGILSDSESEGKAYAKVVKAVEQKIGAYQQLTNEVSTLNQALQDMYAAGNAPSEAFLANLKAQEQKLVDITNAVAVAKNGIASYLGIDPDQDIPDTTDYTTGEYEPVTVDPMAVGDKMSPEDKKAMALDIANSTQNAVFDIVRNKQQAEFDHKMNLLEKQKEKELSNKNLTEEQKAAIEEKYEAKAREIKQDAFKKQKAADIIQAVISTALAVIKALPNIPLSILAGATGAASIAVMASQPVPEFFDGGYSAYDLNDRKPSGITHANEFIGSAKAVRNPTVKPIFDVIDYAQRNGTISQINLPALVSSPTLPGRQSGGYAPGTSLSNSQALGRASGAPFSDDVFMRAINILDRIEKNGVKGNWSLFDLEKIQENKSSIQSATEM